jgi:hypothetical protein
MRVLIALVIAVSVAACAGRSAPDAAPAPAPEVAATDESPKTVDANELTANEQFCEMRQVTGSIMKKRVCRGRSAGPDEVVDQQEIRDVLQDIDSTHTTGGLVIR